MGDEAFDVIVVGAGCAGLCCAGELVRQGLRPLLICESKEVGYQYRSLRMGNNRAAMQHPTRQVGWDGGWWHPLVTELGIEFEAHPSFHHMRVVLNGTDISQDFSMTASPDVLTKSIVNFLPIDVDAEEVERLIVAAQAIPYQELITMDRVPIAEWLEKQGGSPVATMVLLTLMGNMVEFSGEQARQHLSVYGGLALLRSMFCGEADTFAFNPDAREGLLVPLANKIEELGGAVWRGRKVSRLLIEDGRIQGVALADGTEVHAPAVALAAGNSRIRTIFEEYPPEIVDALKYDGHFAGIKEFSLYDLLDEDVSKLPGYCVLVAEADGSFVQAMWSLDGLAPWTVEPGKHLLVTESFHSVEQIAEAGGDEQIFAKMRAQNAATFPGYADAVVDSITDNHLPWVQPYTVGPKLPRTIASVDGLWFVGEGSTPTAGIYMETSASAGILGARDIISAQVKVPG